MAANCYVCGEPAEGDCLICGKTFCRSHGDRLCAQCSEQDELERRAEAYEGLPSPFFFRGALAIAILAVILEIGWDAYKSVSSSPSQAYASPTAISVVQNPTPQPTYSATPQPTTQASPTSTKPASEAATPTPANFVRYTVQPGDNLGNIAAKFGVTLQSIRDANSIDPDRLQIGQTLIIPLKQ